MFFLEYKGLTKQQILRELIVDHKNNCAGPDLINTILIMALLQCLGGTTGSSLNFFEPSLIRNSN